MKNTVPPGKVHPTPRVGGSVASLLQILGVLNLLGGILLVVDGSIAGLLGGVVGFALCFGFAELINYVAYVAEQSAQIAKHSEAANKKLDAIANEWSAPKNSPAVKSPLVPIPPADQPYRI